MPPLGVPGFSFQPDAPCHSLLPKSRSPSGFPGLKYKLLPGVCSLESRRRTFPWAPPVETSDQCPGPVSHGFVEAACIVWGGTELRVGRLDACVPVCAESVLVGGRRVGKGVILTVERGPWAVGGEKAKRHRFTLLKPKVSTDTPRKGPPHLSQAAPLGNVGVRGAAPHTIESPHVT